MAPTRRAGRTHEVLVVPGHAGLQHAALHRDRPHAAMTVDEGVLQSEQAQQLGPPVAIRPASCLNSSAERARTVFVNAVLLACIETLRKGYVFRGQGHPLRQPKDLATFADGLRKVGLAGRRLSPCLRPAPGCQKPARRWKSLRNCSPSGKRLADGAQTSPYISGPPASRRTFPARESALRSL